jgi:dipeptidyl aminopeptidase/acylaminoacyl peptidase
VTELRALLEMQQAWPLSFAADGSWLLVASDATGTRQLFRLRLDDGELEQLTELAEPVDGLLLADDRVLLAVDERGNERTQLSILGEGPLVVDPRFNHWTPVPDARGDLLAYATNRRNGRDFDVVVRDLRTGVDEAVLELGGWCSAGSFSPDSSRLAIGRHGERSGDSDLFVLDWKSGEVVHVSPHAGQAEYGIPVWTGPDTFLAATNEGRDTFAIGRYDLRRGGWEVVLESQWDLACVGDDAGRLLLVEANEDGYSRLELRDAETLELREEVPLPGCGVVEHPVFSRGGSRLAFAFSTMREPHQVWLYEPASGAAPRRLTGTGPVGGADPELHRVPSFDDESIPVFLFAPRGEGPFPVVVTVHGGPESQWRPWYSPGFGALTQFLVSRGYAVAAPNVRGSSGYGKRYEHLDDVALRLDSVRDLAAVHAWLSARPEIDGSRAVVYGRSYGGYMVLAALAFQPELWAAGIEFVGISNLVTFLENTSDYRRAVREREYGSLTHERAILERLSPASRVAAIRAPLFVEHGRNDPRVPVGESEEIHRVLTARGVRCDLVIYEDEGHTIEKLSNRVDCFERAVAFLDEVLR